MKRHWFDNDDIPTNILSRLPVKTLHHLQYVSKQWLNLISDRSFVFSQLQKSTEPLSGFFFQEVFQWTDDDHNNSIAYIPVKQQENQKAEIFTTVLDFLPEHVVILSLTNGLLCCRSCLPAPHPTMYICNPLNKQWTTLQWPNRLPHKETSVALVFDPFRNPVEGSTCFELVAVSQVEVGEDEYCFFFDMYSSKTVSWTRSMETCLCNDNLVKNKGVLVDGIVYWLTDGYQILMFDPLNELSWLIEAPLPAPQIGGSVPEMCIGEWGGKLCYVIVSEDGLQLWGLENQFSSQWEVRVSVSLDELERENANVLYNLSERVGGRLSRDDVAWIDPLAFGDGTLLLRVSACVYSYRFNTRVMRKICGVSDLGPKAMFSPIVVPYTMSLVPLG